MRRTIASYLLLTALFCALAAPGARANPPVGVFRWDFWFKGNPNGTFLMNDTWYHRLPFYAHDGTSFGWAGDSQQTMDQEIGYARDAGLSYFIFNYYNDYKYDGQPNPDVVGRKSLDLYLKSRRISEMKFALMISENGFGDPARWTEQRRHFVDLIARQQYQRGKDGRPIVYLWLGGWLDSLFANHPGQGLGALNELRTDVKTRTGKEPYFIALSFWADKAAGFVQQYQLDAASAYTNPLASNGVAHSYSFCHSLNRWFADSLKAQQLQVVPVVSTGWDPRPVAGQDPYIDRPVTPDYCLNPTPQQIAQNLQDKIAWLQSNPAYASANTIVMYAWNEFTEGGWLTPTLAEGNARLQAIKDLLNPPAIPSVRGPLQGWIDSAFVYNGLMTVTGWACSKGSRDPIMVHLYGGGTMLAKASANELSERAVNSRCSSTGIAHRFRFEVPVAKTAPVRGQRVIVYGLIPGIAVNGQVPNSGVLKVP